jgi:hypothetical protein
VQYKTGKVNIFTDDALIIIDARMIIKRHIEMKHSIDNFNLILDLEIIKYKAEHIRPLKRYLIYK